MNCREVSQTIKLERSAGRASPRPPGLAREREQHLAGCAACHRRFGAEVMTASLLQAYAATRLCSSQPTDEGRFPSPFFFPRLMARIRAERAEPGAGLWEAAILSTRGWLLAFGLLTAVLCAASLENSLSVLSLLAPAPRTLEFEQEVQVLALPPSTENLLITNGEALSHEAVLYTLVSEDPNHGRQ
jgi:hypothetical protein